MAMWKCFRLLCSATHDYSFSVQHGRDFAESRIGARARTKAWRGSCMSLATDMREKLMSQLPLQVDTGWDTHVIQ